MSTTRVRRRPIILHYNGGNVTVEMPDEDRFVLTSQKAAEACRESVRSDQIVSGFKQKFLIPLRQWCDRHADRVSGCFVVPETPMLSVIVHTKKERYDFDLGRSLSALELDLVSRGWAVSVSQLPASEPDDLAGYLNSDFAVEVYAQPQPAQEQGGQ